MPTMQELLPEIEIQEPAEYEGLQVFGLRWNDGQGPAYATLDEATTEDQLVVTEISESGSVPNLRVTNKSHRMVFLMAGEELVGSKQNRVLNASIMVRANSEMDIPVSCVEAGRWAYRSRRSHSAQTISHRALRSQMSKQVMQSYRTTGTPRSDQGGVWQEVSRKLGIMGSISSSSELRQAFLDHEARLKRMHERTPVPAGCSGAIFAFGGEIVGADLFDKPSTLAKLWPKLIRSYGIDAIEKQHAASQLTRDDVKRWLAAAADAKSESFKSPGLGEDIRFEGNGVVGACLSVDNHPVHVELLVELESSRCGFAPPGLF